MAVPCQPPPCKSLDLLGDSVSFIYLRQSSRTQLPTSKECLGDNVNKVTGASAPVRASAIQDGQLSVSVRARDAEQNGGERESETTHTRGAAARLEEISLPSYHRAGSFPYLVADRWRQNGLLAGSDCWLVSWCASFRFLAPKINRAGACRRVLMWSGEM